MARGGQPLTLKPDSMILTLRKRRVSSQWTPFLYSLSASPGAISRKADETEGMGPTSLVGLAFSADLAECIIGTRSISIQERHKLIQLSLSLMRQVLEGGGRRRRRRGSVPVRSLGWAAVEWTQRLGSGNYWPCSIRELRQRFGQRDCVLRILRGGRRHRNISSGCCGLVLLKRTDAQERRKSAEL